MENKKVNFVYATHLSYRKLKRFMDMMEERVKNGVTVEEVVETWNRYQKYPEDTVYLTSKSVSSN